MSFFKTQEKKYAEVLLFLLAGQHKKYSLQTTLSLNLA